jgi:hypothetical protein
MSTMNKTMIGLAAMAIFIMANGATAAPSLGFPKGKPYYGAKQRSGGGDRAMRSYAPARSTETRQSFSYEPAEGSVAAKGGCPESVTVAPAAPKEDVAQAPRTTRRSFSYNPSQKTEPRIRNYRSAAPKKQPWQYPKTDPRRYRP